MPENGATQLEEMIASHARRVGESALADYFADPYRFFAWARAEAPVLHIPQFDCWAVARFDDILSVFRDAETFSTLNVRRPMTSFCPRAVEIYESAGVRLEPTLIDADPQTHRGHRRIFGKGLSTSPTERLEPRIRATVSRHIDDFIGEGCADLLPRLLQPTANRIMFHILGGAEEDFDLADWPSGMRRVEVMGEYTEAAQVSFMELVARVWPFAGRLARAASENPGDNYLGDLVRLRRADPSLFTDNLLQNVVFLLQTAGGDNQSQALAHGIREMLRDRPTWERLCADPGLIPNAVEEILRFGTPLMAFPRLATRDAEIGGQRIPANARIFLLLASGNRDETVFPDGETLDIGRENAGEHLSFGHGPHFCLGAPLARLQMKITLEELTSRLPHMRLADGGVPDIFRTLTFRGLKCLPVEWD